MFSCNFILLLFFVFGFIFKLFFFLFFLLNFFVFFLYVQLRVIRAFRSTLEDLEERRSVHSLHSLRSLRAQNPNMQAFLNTGTQKNLTPFAAHQLYQQQRNAGHSAAAAMSANLSEISFIDEDSATTTAENGRGSQRAQTYNDDLPRPVHETRI